MKRYLVTVDVDGGRLLGTDYSRQASAIKLFDKQTTLRSMVNWQPKTKGTIEVVDTHDSWNVIAKCVWHRGYWDPVVIPKRT